MALSNYDTLAFDEHGKSSIGQVANKERTTIQIYKNWMYIGNPLMWRKDSDFTFPTISQINDGDVQLGGFHILAKRGPQNGVFVLAQSYVKKGKNFERRYFGGIGCVGYKDDVEEVLKKLGREKEISEDWTSGSGNCYADRTIVPGGGRVHFIDNLKTGNK